MNTTNQTTKNEAIKAAYDAASEAIAAYEAASKSACDTFNVAIEAASAAYRAACEEGAPQ